MSPSQILTLPEIVSSIFSFCIRPAVLFRYNLVCRAWNQVVEEEDFFKEHSKEWKPLTTRIDKAFMWTEYYTLYDPIIYDHYLDFKRRLRILSDDTKIVFLELTSNHKKFSFCLKSDDIDNFVIEARFDDQNNIVSDDIKGIASQVKAQRSSYYDRMVETDIEEVNVTNLKSLTSFKNAHFPKVPLDGFYSIIESLVFGLYNSYLIDAGIDGFYLLKDKNKEKVMKIYNDYHFEDSLLSRTLKYRNSNLTEKLMKKGHALTFEQIECLTKYIKHSDTYTALFTCKYLKSNNIDFKKILPDLESILDATPELCEIFLQEKIVECPDILIDIVNQTTHVNYPALQYLKKVKPNLICPLDTSRVKKKRKPKIMILFENPTQEADQKYLYHSMDLTLKIFPQSLNQEKVLLNLTEKCKNMDIILFRPKTFNENQMKDALTLIKKVNPKSVVGIVCFYSSLQENKQTLREVFRTVSDIYLIIDFYPYPCHSHLEELFYQ